MERQPDEQAHHHHPADGPDAEHQNVEHSDERRCDSRHDQQHQSGAAGEAVYHADHHRPRAVPVMRDLSGIVSVNMYMRMLMPVVLMCMSVDLFGREQLAQRIDSQNDQHYSYTRLEPGL